MPKKVLTTIIDELVNVEIEHREFLLHSHTMFNEFTGESKFHANFEESLINIVCSMFDEDDHPEVKEWIDWFIDKEMNPELYTEDDYNVMIDMKPFTIITSSDLADFLLAMFVES